MAEVIGSVAPAIGAVAKGALGTGVFINVLAYAP
jgi:hypothetical protein